MLLFFPSVFIVKLTPKESDDDKYHIIKYEFKKKEKENK